MAGKNPTSDTSSGVANSADAAGTSSNATEDANDLGASPTPEAQADQQELNLDAQATSDEGDTGSEKEDLLSVVRDVVSPAEEAEDGQPDKADAKADDKAEGESGSSDEESSTSEEGEDGEGNEPFHKHPRWQQMRAENERLKDGAQRFEAIQNFMDTSHLSSQEVEEGFNVMALMKNDPASARGFLVHYLDQIDTFLGNKLPDDLRKKVDEGFLTEEDALSVSRSRGEVNVANATLARTRVENEQAQNASVARDIVSAVNAWEGRIAAQDPDYASSKKELVKEILAGALAARPPQNAAEAIQMADHALERANQLVGQIAPKPEPKPQKAPLTSNSTAGAHKPKPNSLLEAVTQAANGN